jgi:hypothetical protein
MQFKDQQSFLANPKVRECSLEFEVVWLSKAKSNFMWGGCPIFDSLP